MTVRHRTQNVNDDMGRAFWSLFGITFRDDTGAYIKERHVCDDVSDSLRLDHPLNITSQVLQMETSDLVNGLLDNGVHYKKFENFVPDYYKTVLLDHLTVSSPPDPSATLAARTNPSTPSSPLPMLVQDIVELPSLIKHAGETLIHSGANAYLAYQFGWKPLINDVKDLCRFAQHAATKSDELHRLWSKGGLKRRISLGRYTARNSEGEYTIVDSGSGAWVSCWKEIHTTVNQWGTIRWLPDVLPPKTESEYAAIAMRSAYGVETIERTASSTPWYYQHASRLSHLYNQAWQLMPWSWLTDWFGNIGDYLAAYDNSIPAHAVGLNVMTHSKTVYTFTRREDLSDPWTSGGGARILVETKARNQNIPSVAASFPWISGNQMSILGALGVQRLPRSKP
jgi:hypothetical protein